MKANRFLLLLLSFILSFSANAYAENELCTEPYKCLNYAMEVYREGRTEEAIQLYKDISTRFEDPKVAGISSFMAGTLMAQSQSTTISDGSESYLEQAYSNYPLIADYALFTLAGLHERRGDYYKAAGIYKSLFITFPDSLLQKKSLMKAADLYLASGEVKTAREDYAVFMSMYPKDKSASNAMYGIAISYIMEDNITSAFNYLNRIWSEYPVTPASRAAKKVIDWLKKEGNEPPATNVIDYYLRGENLYNAGLFEEAATEYKRFLSLRESFYNNMELDAYYKLGLAYYNARNLKEAEDSLEFFLNNYPDDKRSCEVMYSLGRNYLRDGKDDAFVKASKRYIKLCRGKEKGPEVTYRLGIFYSEKNEIDKAFTYLDRIIKEYPKSDYASDSKWAKGWILYKGGKFKKTLAVFDSILKENKNSVIVSRTLYWKARVLEAMNDHDGVTKNVCQLCKNHNGSFYCFFASGFFDLPCTGNENPTAPLLINGGKQQKISLLEEGGEGRNEDSYYSKIKLLLYLGFKEEALEEIRRVRPRLKNERDREKAVLISTILYENGEYNTALSVLYTNFSKEVMYSVKDIDFRVWRLMYPDGYSELVNKYARENGVDPFLLFALIREESWFNNEAVSSSGAMGLMQVMPKTASSILNNSPVERNTMFDPEFNISLGAKFFSDLLKRFDGNIIFAIASYNAGPNAVTKWLKERSRFDLDEFIEDIPYKETRDYVKKVFSSYQEYQRIDSMFSAPLYAPFQD